MQKLKAESSQAAITHKPCTIDFWQKTHKRVALFYQPNTTNMLQVKGSCPPYINTYMFFDCMIRVVAAKNLQSIGNNYEKTRETKTQKHKIQTMPKTLAYARIESC